MIARASRFRIRGFAAVLMAVAFSGCASYRIATSLQPDTPAAGAGDAAYAIGSARLAAAENVDSGGSPDFGIYAIDDATLTEKMVAASVRLRPDVFSGKPGVVPVEVAVTRMSFESSMGVGGCISCLTLTIYPLRTSEETAYTVEVIRPDPDGGQQISAPVSFTREEAGWLSILPGGWIPVPGGKGERTWGTDRALRMTEEQMLAACVEAAAIALGRGEPTAWRKVVAPAPEAAPAPMAEDSPALNPE